MSLNPAPRHTRLRVWICFCLLTSLCLSASARQDSSESAEKTRTQLEQVKEEISRITQEQRSREAERGKLERELRRSEISLSNLRREKQSSARAIETTQSKISKLSAEQKDLANAAAQQRDAVAAEVREAFKRGDDNQLRLLLSEDNPQEIARLLAYYRYVLEARSERLEEYRRTIAQTITVQKDLQEQQRSLETQREALARQETALEKTRTQRQGVLADIEIALQSNAETLAARQGDRQELELLLGKLEEALAQLIPDEDVEAFETARGAMRWPVDGRITQRFGRPRNQGKMRWQGVRLKAKAGTPVAAIHHGRVVYADWFRGMGLLIVIDHSDGYLSLYAHNQSLLREVGDWVGEGVAIATVGDSGGQGEAALYFEIRKDGKPTDPQRWCRS
ncbi:MAG: murein hydrolase activator EnvC [Congregibacter sp.]